MSVELKNITIEFIVRLVLIIVCSTIITISYYITDKKRGVSEKKSKYDFVFFFGIWYVAFDFVRALLFRRDRLNKSIVKLTCISVIAFLVFNIAIPRIIFPNSIILPDSYNFSSSHVYYDRYGNSYNSRYDVLYYDDYGNSYKIKKNMHYLVDSSNKETNLCYINSDGYVVDTSNIDIYVSSFIGISYNEDETEYYYDADWVYWNEDGELFYYDIEHNFPVKNTQYYLSLE